MIRRREFLLLAGAAALARCGGSSTTPPQTGTEDLNFGATLDPTEFTGVLEAVPPDAIASSILAVANPAPATATSVILTNLPAIATQGVPGKDGSPGSCEAQSFGHCLGAYTAARYPDGTEKWDASAPQNEPSAGWLYEWFHHVFEQNGKECPSGSGSLAYLQRLVAAGAPSAQDVPYNPNGQYTTVKTLCDYLNSIDLTQTWPDEANFIIGSYKGFGDIQHKSSTYLDLFKSLIRNGHAIAFSGYVFPGYATPPLNNGVFTPQEAFKVPSGHGQVIVGFDDSKGSGGAFLIQNSFGAGWNPSSSNDPGFNGRIWWPYETFFSSQKSAAIAFPNTAQPFGGFILTSSVQGAPQVALRHVGAHVEPSGKSRLIVVTHAQDALTLTQLSVADPSGSTFTAALNEVLRLGYVYAERSDGQQFAPGTYTIAFTAKLQNGTPVTYSGQISVPYP
jgi:hypothetical protein